MLLASDSPADDFMSLPSWVQLLVGVALVAAAVIGHQVDKKMDNGFLEILSFLLGCAGLYATVLALF